MPKNRDREAALVRVTRKWGDCILLSLECQRLGRLESEKSFQRRQTIGTLASRADLTPNNIAALDALLDEQKRYLHLVVEGRA